MYFVIPRGSTTKKALMYTLASISGWGPGVILAFGLAACESECGRNRGGLGVAFIKAPWTGHALPCSRAVGVAFITDPCGCRAECSCLGWILGILAGAQPQDLTTAEAVVARGCVDLALAPGTLLGQSSAWTLCTAMALGSLLGLSSAWTLCTAMAPGSV